MVEPSWGQIIFSTINGIIMIMAMLKMLSKMPVSGQSKPQKIVKAKGYMYIPTEINRTSVDYDWFFNEKYEK